jgi:LPS O-antigen subunit length determinant protein (WzzB/FepE family)
MNESPQNQPMEVHDDEIDLRELFRVLWAGKWLISGITLTVAVIAVIVTLMMPNIYRAEALLAPNEQGSAGGLSALAARYGNLSNLAGIDIGGGICRQDLTRT